MPYTRKQCRLFGAKSSRGESVPDDWQDYCRKGSGKGSKAKPKAGKPKARRRPSG